ncbi:sulfatase [Flavobacteriaceae bacterium]|jgi:arylsulfatase A-like enzyme|nr:sulfatase [Flavobacteriaceae bacterium]MDC1372333.1 sulfatase [Flavobacteriaceae bacterium]
MKMIISNYTINNFLKLLLFITFIYSLNSYSKTSDEKLNVIWISCEDMGPVLSSYGVKEISTPNIDKLAEEGIKYTNAYSTVGVCAPSRFSIITGMYPARLGAHNMRTGNFYTYKDPDKLTYKQNKGVIDKSGINVPEYEVVTPTNIKAFTEYLRNENYYCINNNKCDYQFNSPFTAWDEVSGNISYKDRPKNTPFFYVKNLMVTHESRIWLRKNEPITVNKDILKIPAYYPDIPEVRNDIAIKYSNIQEMDRQVGEIISDLEKNDLLDKTIIFFWSDHGGNLLRQKRAVGNSGLKVPLIIRFPDGYRSGEVDNRIVSLMDLGPTTMSLLGIKPPSFLDGKAFLGKYKTKPRNYAFGSADRFDESTDMQRSVIDGRFVYIKNFMPELPLIYRNKYREQISMNKKIIQMDRDDELIGDSKYIFMKSKQDEELYDLKFDPYEVDNIANNPDYKDKLIELRNALNTWQYEIDDKGFINESELINEFWPNMIQPITKPVEITVSDNVISLKCETKGASIGYQIGAQIGSQNWKLYNKPFDLSSNQKLATRAIKIGYKASTISNIN